MDASLALRDRLETAEEENRQLRELLKPPITFPAEWRLTAKESELLAILSARAPNAISKTSLHEVLYFADDEAPEPKILDVMICKLRSKLAGVGVEIETRWGFGWRIGLTSRDRLRAAMAAPELVASEQPPQLPAALDEISRDEDHSMSNITISGDSIEASAVLESEESLEEFVRRLWCAAAAVWPDPGEPETDAVSAPKAMRPAVTTDAETPAPMRDGLTRVQQAVLDLDKDEPEHSVASIANRIGCSAQAVYNARAKLRELGLME